jgi:N-acetylglutamate synthase-like GNAT family acetyltransferase
VPRGLLPLGRPGEHRVAAGLLETLLRYARAAQLRTILLGTSEKFPAAHRFYEKHGFSPVEPESLLPTFPRMTVDTRFYRMDLV